MVNPLISDIQSSKTNYSAGDRIIVRTSFGDLTEEVKRKLRRSICKYAKVDLNILIVDCCNVIIWLSGLSDPIMIVGPMHIKPPSGNKRVANLDCSVVDIKQGEILTVSVKKGRFSEIQKQDLLSEVNRWAGDVEIQLSEVN